MKKIILAIILIVSMSAASLTGCGQKKMDEMKQTEEKKKTDEMKEPEKMKKPEEIKDDLEQTKDEAIADMKHYVRKLDQLAVVRDVKDFDLSKSLTDMLEDSEKGEVKKITVDDSKVDYTKPGVYPAEVTMELEKDNRQVIKKGKVDLRVIEKEDAKKQAESGYVVFGSEEMLEAR